MKKNFLDFFQRIFATLPVSLRRSFHRVSILAVVAALTELLLAGAVSLLGVALASPQTLLTARPMRELLNTYHWLQPVTEDPRLLLILVLLGLSLTALLKTSLLALLTWRQSRFSQQVSLHIGSRLFQGYMSAPYLWHTQQKVSQLAVILNWRSSVGIFLFNLLQTLSYLIVAGILFFSICFMTFWGSLLILVAAGGTAGILFRCCRRKVRELNFRIAENTKELSSTVHTGITGIREVIIYQQQQRTSNMFHQIEQSTTNCIALQAIFPPLPSWVLELVGILLLLVTVLILRWQDASLAHISATLTLLAAVAWRLLPVMNRSLQSLITMQQQQHMAEQVLQMLQTVETLPRQITAAQPCPLRRELRMNGVRFRHPGTSEGKEDALRDLDLVIRCGSMVGLVGASGAGKSTLVNLLTGLYEPTGGQILVDGETMTPERRAGWMQRIGYVPQSPFLLNSSIAENVAFSQWGETCDRERVLECCRLAAIDFLEDLPEGIDTVIGERGVRLSGGQLQRVSIARALYHRPQLIIFDEATSALDGATELAIQKTIESLRAEATIIIIAHRLSTVKACDTLYWMENGRIRMQGRTEDVLPAYEAHLVHIAENMQPDP